MTAHSEGPWHVTDTGHGVTINDDWNHPVADIYQTLAPREHQQPSADAQGEANARLIAAAPMMLKALEEIADTYNAAHNGDTLRTLSTAEALAVEAIATAKGEV